MTIHTSQSVSCLDPQLEKPLTKKELGTYIKTYLDIDIPSRSICEDHHSPMDYLWFSYAEDFQLPIAGCRLKKNRKTGLLIST